MEKISWQNSGKVYKRGKILKRHLVTALLAVHWQYINEAIRMSEMSEMSEFGKDILAKFRQGL